MSMHALRSPIAPLQKKKQLPFASGKPRNLNFGFSMLPVITQEWNMRLEKRLYHHVENTLRILLVYTNNSMCENGLFSHYICICFTKNDYPCIKSLQNAASRTTKCYADLVAQTLLVTPVQLMRGGTRPEH